MKIYFSSDQGVQLTFEENISYDCLPEIDFAQGSVELASGDDFVFDRSSLVSNIHTITWPVLSIDKMNELILWLRDNTGWGKVKFNYVDPFGDIHLVRLYMDKISFKPLGSNGKYVTGSLVLKELVEK
jgi:hypothetical protein